MRLVRKQRKKDTFLQEKDNGISKRKMNLLNNKPNQPAKFRRKSQVEINDESRGTYNLNLKLQC